MSVRFHMLASGSSGNVGALEVGGQGVLIDFGLSPRRLAARMRGCRLSWERIRAVMLTHVHTDHWRAATLSLLAKLRIPVYCHRAHLPALDRNSRAYAALSSAGLIRCYEPGERLTLPAECHCVPIALDHDDVMTCGFRFEGCAAIFGVPWAIGYATDLGCWRPDLARQLADVDLLAIEFNHDVAMQLESGRHPQLIRRVLSDLGHLSNEQAAGLLTEVVKLSEPGRLRHVVQLHLSRECNRPELAERAARQALDGAGVALPIHIAYQDSPGPTIALSGPAVVSRRPVRVRPARPNFVQPLLPFAR